MHGAGRMTHHARGGRAEQVVAEPGPVRADHDAVDAVGGGVVDDGAVGMALRQFGPDARHTFELLRHQLTRQRDAVDVVVEVEVHQQ